MAFGDWVNFRSLRPYIVAGPILGGFFGHQYATGCDGAVFETENYDICGIDGAEIRATVLENSEGDYVPFLVMIGENGQPVLSSRLHYDKEHDCIDWKVDSEPALRDAQPDQSAPKEIPRRRGKMKHRT